MKLLRSLLVGAVLLSSSTLRSQTIARTDVIGTWAGTTDMGPKLRVLWPDGLWWGNHGGGRWRLSGDTLWLGDDWRYGYGGIVQRVDIPHGDTVDTLKMVLFMQYLANDPHYWTGTQKERAKFYHDFYRQRFPKTDRKNDQSLRSIGTYERVLLDGFSSYIAVFKVSLKNDTLTLVRINELSDPSPPNVALGPRESKGTYVRSNATVHWMSH